MNAPILHVHHLEKKLKTQELSLKNIYKRIWHNVSFEITQPGFYVIAGKNGSGKSTLLRCILGLIHPQQGTVEWFGQKKLHKNDIGYLPEFPVIPPALKMKDWICWMLDTSLNGLFEKMKQFEKYPCLSIEPFLNVPANRLSKGQLQKTQLWLTLAHNPKGIILDEPFSGLDPWARVELAQLLVQVIQEGTFVLMSTHELPEVLREITQKTFVVENETVTEHLGCALPK